MSWKHPNTITGQVAEGAKYFKRKEIQQKLWREINKGNHILFLAPRRVGKSSIVKFMAKNPDKYFKGLYRNIQSDSSVQDFYQRLFEMTLEILETYGWVKNLVKTWKQRWSIKSIGEKGIEFGAHDIDFRSAFFEMLHDLKKQEVKIVLFLDEFPDVVKKINERHGKEEAMTLLDDLRELRSNDDFKKVFVLVLLGSVGLNHIVKQVSGRTDKVNDLHKESLRPLEKTEVNDFINHLVQDATMVLSEEVREFLYNKLRHYIPFFLQLLIEECDDILFEEGRPELTTNDIDLAYGQLVKKNAHFSDWEERLKEYFPSKYPFLMEILIKCAINDGISIQEIYDLATVHNCQLTYKSDLDDILLADGYLFESEQNYFFNSPLLRDWWKQRHPII